MNNVGLSPVDINQDDIDSVVSSLQSGWLAHGEQNKLFEREFSEYLGVKHAITLNSCTSALDLSIRCHDFEV